MGHHPSCMERSKQVAEAVMGGNTISQHIQSNQGSHCMEVGARTSSTG